VFVDWLKWWSRLFSDITLRLVLITAKLSKSHNNLPDINITHFTTDTKTRVRIIYFLSLFLYFSFSKLTLFILSRHLTEHVHNSSSNRTGWVARILQSITSANISIKLTFSNTCFLSNKLLNDQLFLKNNRHRLLNKLWKIISSSASWFQRYVVRLNNL